MNTHSFQLHKWFPAADQLATSFARLCILREDFYLELQGISMSDDITALDGNSPRWRRMYFLRNYIRTLMEIRSTVESLQKNRCFRSILQKQGRALQDEV